MKGLKVNQVEESVFLKRVEQVTSNMLDPGEAASTWVTLVEMEQKTPTIAETLLQQLEASQQGRHTGEQSEPVNTQDAIEAFLMNKADAGAAEGYLDALRRRLRPFPRHYPELPTSSEAIREYLRRFKTADVPTRQDQWKALSMLYRFAESYYGISNPTLTIDKPRFKKKPGQRLSRDQAKQLLSAVKTDLEWGLVTCYFGLRFRRVEAQRLRLGDIKSDYIIVQGKERTEELPLLSVFRDKLLVLRVYQGSDDPLFSIKADTMAYHIERVFRRAGIEGVRASPHTLRNTAGALWSTFGGDWTSNRQLLRHSARTMTDHYSPLTIDELRVKDERHNPMLNLMRELGLVESGDYPDTSSVPPR